MQYPAVLLLNFLSAHQKLICVLDEFVSPTAIDPYRALLDFLQFPVFFQKCITPIPMPPGDDDARYNSDGPKKKLYLHPTPPPK